MPPGVKYTVAYPYSLQNLYAPRLYGAMVEIVNPAQALAKTGKARAIDPLINLLNDTAQPSIMRECASQALGFTSDVRCVDVGRAHRTALPACSPKDSGGGFVAKFGQERFRAAAKLSIVKSG
jgi:hypothetical protein